MLGDTIYLLLLNQPQEKRREVLASRRLFASVGYTKKILVGDGLSGFKVMIYPSFSRKRFIRKFGIVSFSVTVIL